jgi:YGGT family protein
MNGRLFRHLWQEVPTLTGTPFTLMIMNENPTTYTLIPKREPVSEIVWFLLTILELLLIFRFVLKLLAANTSAGFTNFIYSASLPFVKPFQYVIPTSYSQGAVLEWSTVLAMVVYWLVASLIIYLIDLMMTPQTLRIER